MKNSDGEINNEDINVSSSSDLKQFPFDGSVAINSENSHTKNNEEHLTHNLRVQNPIIETIDIQEKLGEEISKLRLLESKCSFVSETSIKPESNLNNEEENHLEVFPNNNCVFCQDLKRALREHLEKKRKLEDEKKALDQEINVNRNIHTALLTNFANLDQTLKVKCTAFEDKICQLKSRNDELNAKLLNLTEVFNQTKSDLSSKLDSIHARFLESIAEKKKLETHYEALIGLRHSTAIKFSEQEINVPENIEELQLIYLQMREKIVAYECSLKHLNERNKAYEKNEIYLTNNLNHYKQLNQQLQDNESNFLKRIEEFSKYEALLHQEKENISKLCNEIASLKREKVKDDEKISELKSTIVSLRSDMDSNVGVLQDFVLHSQQLQVNLERLRTENNELRWQDPEEVSSCYNCKKEFSSMPMNQKKKTNCRHCGKIFCSICLTKSVKSLYKPNKAHSVCDLCHTLLVPNSAPYFSQQKNEPN